MCVYVCESAYWNVLVCMCVYVCVCVCQYWNKFVCVCVSTYWNVCVCVCLRAYLFGSLPEKIFHMLLCFITSCCMYICVHACMHPSIHTYMRSQGGKYFTCSCASYLYAVCMYVYIYPCDHKEVKLTANQRLQHEYTRTQIRSRSIHQHP